MIFFFFFKFCSKAMNEGKRIRMWQRISGTRERMAELQCQGWGGRGGRVGCNQNWAFSFQNGTEAWISPDGVQPWKLRAEAIVTVSQRRDPACTPLPHFLVERWACRDGVTVSEHCRLTHPSPRLTHSAPKHCHPEATVLSNVCGSCPP